MAEVYLIRHGIAVERGICATDEERPLTAEGHRKTQQVAKRLRQLSLQFDVILTSPLVRAYQTASILLERGLSKEVVTFDALAPAGEIEAWLTWLDKQQKAGNARIALVGHQPDLGMWAEILVWGQAREVMVLKKAGIIGLTLPASGSPIANSSLFWLTSPKLLL